MARTRREARLGRHRPAPADRAAAPRPPARLSGSALALIGIAAVTLASRLAHVTHGLPDFVEEAIPLRRAMIMWEGRDGRLDWNPHLFHYPSLSFYLHLLVQGAVHAVRTALGEAHNRYDHVLDYLRDPTASVIAARTLHVLADTTTVAAIGVVGERLRRGAGLVAAALLAVSPTMIHTSRSIYTDTLMACFAALAVERMFAWLERGGTTRLWTAAALVGLAGGTKYPALALILPLLAAAAWRRGSGIPGRLATCGAIALLTFLATTPFALLDWSTFVQDLGFVRSLAASGHLGNLERAGFAYHLRNLARDLSWPGVVLCFGSLALLVRPSPLRPRLALIAATLLLFGLPIALARIEAERYLVSVLPWASLLCGVSLAALIALLPARARIPAGVVAAAALLAPTLKAGAAAALRDPEGTQVQARRWCESHLGLGDLVVEELYGPNLPGRVQHLGAMTAPAFALASPTAQARFRARRVFSEVRLPIATVGNIVVSIPTPGGREVRLQVLPHASDFDRVFYDPRLLRGVRYLVTSSVVRRRFEADRARYAAEAEFYALVDSTAEVAARFDPRGGVDGPNVVVYRLGERTQAAVAAFGPLDPLWWAESVPRAYREEAQRLLTGDTAAAPGVWTAEGTPSLWVLTLADLFRVRLRVFCLSFAVEHAEHQHLPEAMAFARAQLEMNPSDEASASVLAQCALVLGRAREVRPVLERSMAALEREGGPSPSLRAMYQRLIGAEAAGPGAAGGGGPGTPPRRATPAGPAPRR